MWFEELFGFAEQNPAKTRVNFRLDGEYLESLVNGKRYAWGRLECPSLADLRARAQVCASSGPLKLSKLVANVQELHIKEEADGLFQVASQFNLLEMAKPSLQPEDGIGIYEYDRTQGPAAAIACGAGTVYRNYFVPIGQQLGQSSGLQLNMLEELLAALNCEDYQYQNGYLFMEKASLLKSNEQLAQLSTAEKQALKGKLRVGVQWRAEVTLSGEKKRQSQIYASALPIAYSALAQEDWQPLAQLILSASYEMSFYLALENWQKHGNPRLYLTLLGAGVFGNPLPWVLAAITEAKAKFVNCPLEVKIVSYGQAEPALQSFF